MEHERKTTLDHGTVYEVWLAGESAAHLWFTSEAEATDAAESYTRSMGTATTVVATTRKRVASFSRSMRVIRVEHAPAVDDGAALLAVRS